MMGSASMEEELAGNEFMLMVLIEEAEAVGGWLWYL